MSIIKKLFVKRDNGGTSRSVAPETKPLPAKRQNRIQQTEALIGEGNQLEDAGKLDEAEACYRKALELDPECARAYLNIGNVMEAHRNMDEAEANYRKALKLDPQYGGAYANLGRIRLAKLDNDEALTLFARAVELIPGAAGVEAWSGLGYLYWLKDKKNEAMAAYSKVLGFKPFHEAANLAMGRLLNNFHRHDEAAGLMEKFVSVFPDNAAANAILADAYFRLGLVDKGFERISKAYELEPDSDHLAGRIFMSNSMADFPPEKRFEEQKAYVNREFAKYFRGSVLFENERNPGRRLKIGYVSSDFKVHPVAVFVETLFQLHDRSKFEIHAWHASPTNDHITQRLKGLSDVWHDVSKYDDPRLYEAIRDEKIDILIDLSGFTGGHRLPVFARKAAPVQATWLGYLGTTGLETMDYRICDNFTDPVGLTERYHTEKLARLSHCQWCHSPYESLPELSELPLLSNGYVTLGSFNAPSKINNEVLSLWGRIMRRIPDSRMRFSAIPQGRGKQRIIEYMDKLGIDSSRLHFVPRVGVQEYMKSIGDVDIALDPFPYNGGTTTIDTLIMGVPVVTLEGMHSIARGGVSILSNVGLMDFIAHSKEQYVSIVANCADSPEKLTQIRKKLRSDVMSSPLFDGEVFTRSIEVMYQEWWQKWCHKQK